MFRRGAGSSRSAWGRAAGLIPLGLGLVTGVFFCFAAASRAEAVVEVSGQSIDHFPHLDADFERVWEIVKTVTHLEGVTEDPHVHVDPFQLEAQTPEWRQWQRVWLQQNFLVWQEWSATKSKVPVRVDSEFIAHHVDKTLPFPKKFRSFYYQGTNRVQVSPEIFTAHLQKDPRGVMRDMVGYGHYSVGHELLHYALALKQVPIELHHCLFLKMHSASETDENFGLIESVVQQLIEEKFSTAAVIMFGLNQEKGLNPCAKLEDQGEKQINDWSVSGFVESH